MQSSEEQEPARGRVGVRRLFGLGTYLSRAVALVWVTNPHLSLWLAAASLAAGVLPVFIAYVGKLIVDGVIVAAASGGADDRGLVVRWLVVELCLIAALLAAYRGLAVCEALLRVQLAQHVTERVLRKTLSLELSDLESPAVQDLLTRARKDAAHRPLGLVRSALTVAQESLSLIGYAVLIARFSPWLVLLMGLAALPAIIAEVRFNADAFRLYRRQTPDARRQEYLETVVAQLEYAQEVKTLGIGPYLLEEHARIFRLLFEQDRKLTVRRGVWGFLLASLGAAALAAGYAVVAWAAMDKRVSIGEMAMLFIVLKQAQSLVGILLVSVAAMHEDNLYLSLLHDYLEYSVVPRGGTAKEGVEPGAGLRFEQVSFTYPGRSEPALRDVTFSLPAGTSMAVVGENGAGKTTLAKLAMGLYAPGSGRILVDELDVREWDRDALLARMAVVVQDFARYQLSAGRNIGLGDVAYVDDAERWKEAGQQALIHEDVSALPDGYATQLGRLFDGGLDLSLGQWQRIALARMFMRDSARLLILDEPTSRLDPAAEAALLRRLATVPASACALIVSHRLASVRAADTILVLEHGRVVERGTHEELATHGGVYAALLRATERASEADG